MKGACHCVVSERRHDAGRLGWSLPLLSLPVRDARRRRRPQRRWSEGTRPGAWDGVFPSSRSQSGMRAGDDDRSDDGATARGRALVMESSPPLAPSQGCEQGTTTAETTERRHEAGRLGWSLPLLSLPVRDASRGRRWRYHEGTSGTNGTNKLGAF